MAIDISSVYWDLVTAAARANGVDNESLRKLRSAQLLRSLGSKNAFTKAAHDVAQNISLLRTFLLENQQQYALPGRLKEAERDQVEEQVAVFSRACSNNISKLQSMLHIVPSASPAKAPLPVDRPEVVAHRQGMVLILSERLGSLTSTFDRLRSLRYRQLQEKQSARRRRMPSTQAFTPGARNALTFADVSSTPDGQQQQQHQQVVDEENIALQAELLNMVDQVQHAERSVREIATLNQMFSTAILQQSEQIEILYNEAVAVTGTIGRANVELGKTVRTNRSAQKWMFLLLVMASLALLFLDWWYS